MKIFLIENQVNTREYMQQFTEIGGINQSIKFKMEKGKKRLIKHKLFYEMQR